MMPTCEEVEKMHSMMTAVVSPGLLFHHHHHLHSHSWFQMMMMMTTTTTMMMDRDEDAVNRCEWGVQKTNVPSWNPDDDGDGDDGWKAMRSHASVSWFASFEEYKNRDAQRLVPNIDCKDVLHHSFS